MGLRFGSRLKVEGEEVVEAILFIYLVRKLVIEEGRSVQVGNVVVCVSFSALADQDLSASDAVEKFPAR